MSRQRIQSGEQQELLPLGSLSSSDDPPRRTAPYQVEPGFSEEAGLWFYGNIKLLHSELAYVPQLIGIVKPSPKQLDEIEQRSEELVLGSKILVCGVHNPAHQRAAIVPLRWGSPRIVVFSGGFTYHLGDRLTAEPFLAARLWREGWDARTDLAVTRRAPDRLPTFAHHNPTVDRLIENIALRRLEGLNSPRSRLAPLAA